MAWLLTPGRLGRGARDAARMHAGGVLEGRCGRGSHRQARGRRADRWRGAPPSSARCSTAAFTRPVAVRGVVCVGWPPAISVLAV